MIKDRLTYGRNTPWLVKVKCVKGLLKLVLRLPSRVLIQRNLGMSLGFFPPVTMASWLQPAVVTERKQAWPSEST